MTASVDYPPTFVQRMPLGEAVESTIPAMRAWLQTFQPDDLVGRPSSSIHCPIARWLSHMTGRMVVCALDQVRSWDESDAWKKVPKWMQRFQYRAFEVLGGDTMLTAAQCLAVLDKLEVEGLT